MTANKILEIELELKKNGLTNLGIAVFKKKFLQKYEVALLIGPNEPFFWDNFKKSKEFNSSRKNPLNNWSKRIIDEISKKFSGKAFYPFQKNPVIPFYDWALISDKFWESPVKLLVHENRGLMVSFRGAIAFKNKKFIKNTVKTTSPCVSCTAPCKSTCPVSAFRNNKYDVETCINFIRSTKENICINGCLVRRSCPIGQSLRKIEQSKFHMKYFINEDKL